MDNTNYVILISLLAMASLGLADTNVTFDYYCPRIVCTNDTFVIWADFEYNETDITTADVEVDGSDLYYNTTYEDFRAEFISGTSQVWNYTLIAFDPIYGGATASCSTEIIDCYNLTVTIWQEQEYKIIANTSHYAIKEKNYDKQLNDPYINDFAYILAINNDINISGLNNDSCNLGKGSEQKALEMINIGNWLGNEVTRSVVSLLGDQIGCNRYWFRAPYLTAQAILRLPYAGNYTIFLLDGTFMWNNEYSPPDLVKSNLYLDLGKVNIPNKADYTMSYWVSHDEIDFWGAFTDSLYVPMVFLSFIIFIALIMFGIAGIRTALGITLLWIAIWTLLRML